MATLASLNIALTADSAKLKNDLNKAKGHTKKWSADQKKQFAAMKTSLMAVGAVASVVGLAIGKALGSATGVAKELKVMSDLTGASTDRLQRITPALLKAGISMEKYADIIKDVNDKTHDFLQNGGGPMVDFFDNIAPKVGITKDAFVGLSGEQGLQLYVNSLEKANLSQEQMTFYMEAIASDSTMLLPLLKDNAAGLDEMASSAGVLLSEETIANLTSMSAGFNNIGTSITNMIANNLSGWIGTVSEYLIAFNERMAGADTATTNFGTATDNVVLAMGDEITQANLLFTLMGTGVTMSQSVAVAKLSEARAHLRSAAAKRDEAKAEAALQMVMLQSDYTRRRDALRTIREGTDAYEEQEQSIAGILTDMNSMNNLTKGLDKGFEEAAAEVERIQAAIDGAVDGMVVFDGQLITAAGLSERLAKAMSKTRPMMRPMDLGVSGTSGGGSGGGGSNKSKTEADKIKAVTQSILDNADSTKTFYETTAEQFVSGLKSSFSTALASGDWKGFLDSVLDSFTMGVISSFTEGLFAPMQDAIGGFMEGLFSGMGGGGGGFFSGLTSIFGFAEGGIVPTTSTSKSYADSVPAMLQPGELVVPKSQVDNFMNGAGSGGGQTFNINVTGDVSRLTRSEIVKMMPEIAAGTNMLNKENGRR